EPLLPRDRSRYDVDDPAYRMLHLTYLETRFPDVYETATTWQPFPAADVQAILDAFAALKTAYHSGDDARFNEASQAFFATVEKTSEKVGPYPGQDSVGDRIGILFRGDNLNPPGRDLLDLELKFNRGQPFRWARTIMLP